MSEYSRSSYPSWEAYKRDPEIEADYCQRIGKSSAQSMVFLLPEDYNMDIVTSDITYDVVEVQRVLKVSHSHSQAVSAVATLNLEPEHRHESKANELVLDGAGSIPRSMRVAVRAHEIDVLMGNPLLCSDVGRPYEDGYHTAYTQDYSIPISDLLKTLDATDTKQVAAFIDLIDAFVETELLLCRHGIFEKTFKFADNFGVFPHLEVFPANQDRIRLIDLGEISTDLQVLLDAIDTKKWEKVADQSESTQLPPILQTYLNKRCEERLTLRNVLGAWTSKVVPSDESLSVQRVFDYRIPPGLPRTLWQRSTPTH
jgi:hypothetical protein